MRQSMSRYQECSVKKWLFMRALFGAPMGIVISYMITLFISVLIGDGNFYPVPSGLMERCGSELNAVIVQTLLSAVVGSGFSMAAVIWKLDSWSLARQSCLHFAIVCVIMFPIAYYTGWMPHTVVGIAGYVSIFVVLYLAIWGILYAVWKHKISTLNHKFTGEGS